MHACAPREFASVHFHGGARVHANVFVGVHRCARARMCMLACIYISSSSCAKFVRMCVYIFARVREFESLRASALICARCRTCEFARMDLLLFVSARACTRSRCACVCTYVTVWIRECARTCVRARIFHECATTLARSRNNVQVQIR